MILTITAAMLMAGAPMPTSKTTFLPITVVRELTAREVRQRARRERHRCRIARWHDGDVAELRRRELETYEILQVADNLRDGTSSCPRDPNTAIAIMEQVAAPDPMQTVERDAARSLHFALLERSRPGDVARATDIARMLWLRGDVPYAPDLTPWTDAERLAFLTRDDVWAYLQIAPTHQSHPRQQLMAALSDPRSPRHDPAAALVLMESLDPVGAAQVLLAGIDVPRDQARAERVLARVASMNERARLMLVPLIAERMAGLTGAERRAVATPLNAFINEHTPGGAAARTAMLPVLLEDLANASTPDQQRAAIGTLQTFVARGAPTAEAPLLAWTEAHLRDPDEATRRLAYTAISTLLNANNPAARRVFDADMASNGLVDHRPLTLVDFRSGAFINDDDYPSRALRDEWEGIVEAIATIDPSGRVIEVQIMRSAGYEPLDQAVITAARRRIRVQTSVTNGRYIRAALPPVHFLLPEDENPQHVSMPPQDDAIIVRGRLIQRPNLEIPIPVTTISAR